MRTRRRVVWLVQQGVWDMPKESMPLGVGYLKAAALDDDAVRQECEIRVFNFNGGDSVISMAHRMFAEGVPDVVGFSVWGWNYLAFGHLAETCKQFSPEAWVVVGGTHVANQAERVFRQFPHVDVVVNGEGEFVFRDLILANLRERAIPELGDIDGISFRDAGGEIRTTAKAERIQNLDRIPSPFLTGAIPLTDHAGEFRYDVALIETNRGCPYSCSFCYWGGAVGQKMRTFSRDRLREELELFAFHKVHTLVLCDSNFGMLHQDLEFVEDVSRCRRRHGYPRTIEGSWAKNKSKIFYEIVHRMRAEGLQSSFTLALQTLNEPALDLMRRRNMRVNDWEDLVQWLQRESLDCYAELIWGVPGETTESFLAGYDRLATHISRIAPYQLLLLPNTEYAEHKERFGFVTVRGDQDDFEHVLAHSTMTIAENLEMQRFLVWARAVAEQQVLRHIWSPLRELAGMSQSTVIRGLMEWVEKSSHPSAVALTAIRQRAGMAPSALTTFLRQLYRDRHTDDLLDGWWRSAIVPALPPEHAGVVSEVFRFDYLTRPLYDEPKAAAAEIALLEVVEVDGERYYRRPDVRFAYDVPALLRQVRAGGGWAAEPRPFVVDLYYKVGFHQFFANHEEAAYFLGRPLEDVMEVART